MRKIQLILIHCAATPPSMDIGAAEIDRWHRLRGFDGIGYHYVIRRDGTLELGRLIGRVGAHAQGHNYNSIGVCLVGGVDEKGKAAPTFTPMQFEALRTLIVDLRKQFPHTHILGHRDLPGVKKDCPSFDVRDWCRALQINPEPPA